MSFLIVKKGAKTKASEFYLAMERKKKRGLIFFCNLAFRHKSLRAEVFLTRIVYMQQAWSGTLLKLFGNANTGIQVPRVLNTGTT